MRDAYLSKIISEATTKEHHIQTECYCRMRCFRLLLRQLVLPTNRLWTAARYRQSSGITWSAEGFDFSDSFGLASRRACARGVVVVAFVADVGGLGRGAGSSSVFSGSVAQPPAASKLHRASASTEVSGR